MGDRRPSGSSTIKAQVSATQRRIPSLKFYGPYVRGMLCEASISCRRGEGPLRRVPGHKRRRLGLMVERDVSTTNPSMASGICVGLLRVYALQEFNHSTEKGVVAITRHHV